MAGNGRRDRFACAVLVTLALAWLGGARLADAQQPASIAFVLSNGSCNDEGLDVPSTLDFFVNEHLVGSAPARQECTCAPPDRLRSAFAAASAPDISRPMSDETAR